METRSNKVIPTFQMGNGDVGIHLGISKHDRQLVMGFSFLKTPGEVGSHIPLEKVQEPDVQVLFPDTNNLDWFIQSLEELSAKCKELQKDGK